MMPTLATRDDRLHRLARMTKRHAQDIIDAISADFGNRSAHETLIADLLAVDEAIKHARRHLRGWMRPKDVPTGLKYRPGYNRLIPQPLGVVGVVAPWNYPYQLSMLPALAALAAGNRVMIKPSELTPRTAELMARHRARDVRRGRGRRLPRRCGGRAGPSSSCRSITCSSPDRRRSAGSSRRRPRRT